MPKRVFISHSSQDKPAIERLALALEDHGLAPWYDSWEIGAGDNIVVKINQGLEEADAGIVVFSANALSSGWVTHELSVLLMNRIDAGKPLIPVLIDRDLALPAILRPLAWRLLEEVDAIADAVLGRKPRGARPKMQAASVDQVVFTLRHTANGIAVQTAVNGDTCADHTVPALPRAVAKGRAAFLKGFRTGLRRSPAQAERQALDARLRDLGQALGSWLLPPTVADTLLACVTPVRVGHTVQVWFESEDQELLGLPFEALRLPDGRIFATLPGVVMLRRLAHLPNPTFAPPAGPLKVLVAVAAPDEGQTIPVALDQERELHNILDALDAVQRDVVAQVRILEVGHPDAIAEALMQDAYHILHLSCHGSPGSLELENEDGQALPTDAATLLAPLTKAKHPLPLVVLNTCHGAVATDQTTSLAEAFLHAGVPCVLAMQTSVSDYYATALAGRFYRYLAQREHHLASWALAEARRDLERQRQQEIQRKGDLYRTQPEYATPTLYIRGTQEARLANFGLDREPLKKPPIYTFPSPVPQLGMDDLVGRRKELRTLLRTVRATTAHYRGVLVSGIGGIGKSALTGRAMRRLAESGYVVAAHKGPWQDVAVAEALSDALGDAPCEDERQQQQRERLCERLSQPNLDERQRVRLLGRVLANERVVLVLDDMETNLTPEGTAFLDPTLPERLNTILSQAQNGRVLMTCRYPLPDVALTDSLFMLPLGPLTPAATRKLIQRLPYLQQQSTDDLRYILRALEGHPRLLELLDALLNTETPGQGRLPHVTQKLRTLLAEHGVSVSPTAAPLTDAVHEVILLGMRDVFLAELVAQAEREQMVDVLYQAAVSTLPVSPAGIAHMLADAPQPPTPALEATLQRLADLSLLYRYKDGSVRVHRWTAEGFAHTLPPATWHTYANRAGRYRVWRMVHASRDLADGLEAVRNYLEGHAYDAAAQIAEACFAAFRRLNQTSAMLGFAAEVLERLPTHHASYPRILDQEARAYLVLGYIQEAVQRYATLVRHFEQRVAAEPDRADYQRDLSVSYNKMGDLYRVLGQGEKATEYYLKDLDIAQRLAQAEPDRADYQLDLVRTLAQIGLSGLFDPHQPLHRALALLEDLHATNRLAPAQLPLLDYLRKAVTELPSS